MLVLKQLSKDNSSPFRLKRLPCTIISSFTLYTLLERPVKISVLRYKSIVNSSSPRARRLERTLIISFFFYMLLAKPKKIGNSRYEYILLLLKQRVRNPNVQDIYSQTLFFLMLDRFL